ncbi:hypothetical protein B0O80DRAFT_186753 [Mortierella sp. GBAus27b]|nr:hypothetical protein B0O80DRAFT_186753 [Mortierella sp. GBAus27b]
MVTMEEGMNGAGRVAAAGESFCRCKGGIADEAGLCTASNVGDPVSQWMRTIQKNRVNQRIGLSRSRLSKAKSKTVTAFFSELVWTSSA